MSLIQKIIILFNVWPFTYVFHAIYSLGLHILVKVLSRNEAVRAVYGTGSFFEGRCLYGLSDIDLIIIVDERFTRIDIESYKITESYNRIQRIFPFLGDWHEKAESIIFLADVQDGFPLLDSFRLLWKQKRLNHIYGKNLPQSLIPGAVNSNDAVMAINTLIRMMLTKKEIYFTNLYSWKKMFNKLKSFAEALSLDVIIRSIATHEKLGFMAHSDRSLFVRKIKPDDLFSVFIEMANELFTQIGKRESAVLLKPKLLGNSHFSRDKEKDALQKLISERTFLSEIQKRIEVDFKTIRSSLFGMVPKLNYFPLDEPIPVLSLDAPDFSRLKRICLLLYRYGRAPESYLVEMPGMIFIICKIQSFVDVIPLDPLIYANIYAQIQHNRREVSIPETIYKTQMSEGQKMFHALARLYNKNEGKVKNLGIPCYYTEDDLVVIKDAFHCMRFYLLHSQNLDVADLNDLVNFLGELHPECRCFLIDTLDYYRNLSGTGGKNNFPNNVYRCLHQFMAKLLTGASDIKIDDHHKRLGITVGIITRNRAGDLKEVLESLRRQTRPADEVVVVDNGSTDTTRSEVDKYRKMLPINYYYLKTASIPMARNMVIENASHEIVSFTDDDCITEPEWLSSVERGFLRAENIGIVGGWVKHETATIPSTVDTYYSLYHHYTT